MSKHTPGPWRVDETKALGAYGVWTEYATHPGHDKAGYPSQVCSVITDAFSLTGDNRDERDANARLIAAAPEMLALLLRCVIYGNLIPALKVQVEAAIAKAEGQS